MSQLVSDELFTVLNNEIVDLKILEHVSEKQRLRKRVIARIRTVLNK